MQLPFWEWMISGDDPLPTDECVMGQLGLVMRGGVLKSVLGPYRARDRFQIPANDDGGPIWTFDRMGATQTELPDGRVICVGGEHEDYYDPDFHIYNDVVVFSPDGGVEIYGYPKDVFPPTDFHTASLVGNRLILIGCLGYPDDRRLGETPVFSLNLDDYRISRRATTGPSPGWIRGHIANVATDGTITVEYGEVIISRGEVNRTWQNFNEFVLDPQTGVWNRRPSLPLHQFLIRREGWERLDTERGFFCEDFLLPDIPELEALGESDWKSNQFWLRTQKTVIAATVGLRAVEVAVRGACSANDARQLAEAFKGTVEQKASCQCVLEQF